MVVPKNIPDVPGPNGSGEPKRYTYINAASPRMIEAAALINVPFFQYNVPSAAGTSCITMPYPSEATGTKNP